MVETSTVVADRILSLLAETDRYSGLRCDSVVVALNLIKIFRPDALLLDLYLNDGSGFSLLEMVRELEPGMPVVALSQNQGPQYEMQVKARGGNAFLCKTTQFDELLPTLDRLLGAGKQEARDGPDAGAPAHEHQGSE